MAFARCSGARGDFAHSKLCLFAQINFKCIEIVFCPKPRIRTRPERERRRVHRRASRPHPSPGLSQNTARARAPDFLIIFQSIFMRKNLASSLSLLFSLVVFRQSQIHSIRRRRRSARPKLSTLYIISLLPPLSCPALSPSLSLSHSLAYAACIPSPPMIALDGVLHISCIVAAAPRAISFARFSSVLQTARSLEM